MPGKGALKVWRDNSSSKRLSSARCRASDALAASSSASAEASDVLATALWLINDWNSHGVVEMKGSIDLEPGVYPIKVEFFQGVGGASITVSWEGPGFKKLLLTDAVLVTQPWEESG